MEEIKKQLAKELEQSVEVSDLFRLVQSCVSETLGRRRAGLMLGLSPMGFAQQGFIGAYHQMGSNLIVINSSLLKRIASQTPETLKYHVFHLLLHEYLHSLGITEEERVKALTYVVCSESFGKSHLLTKISENYESFLPDMRLPGEAFKPPETAEITLVPGFDREGTTYIG